MKEVIQSYYQNYFFCSTAAFIAYGLPRHPMYLLAVWKSRNYTVLKKYFRTRVTTLTMLGVIMTALLVSILFKISDLVDALNIADPENPQTITWLLLINVFIMVLWLSCDLYWTVGIKVYKSSKKGKHEKEGRNQYVRVDSENIETRLN